MGAAEQLSRATRVCTYSRYSGDPAGNRISGCPAWTWCIFHPALTRTDGAKIPATEEVQLIEDHPYQRWSRHRTPQNPWIPGQDSLATHIMLVEDWLEREFER